MGTIEGTPPPLDASIPLVYPPVAPEMLKFFPDAPPLIFYTAEVPPDIGLARLTLQDGPFVAEAGDEKRKTVEIPVPRGTREIPTAVQQRYLSQAVDQAVAQMDFGDLSGKQVTLSIAGVMPMSDMDLGGYIRQSLVSKIALAGGRVVESGGNTEIVIRVGQSGLDKVEETKTQTNERTRSRIPILPITALVIGSGLAVGGAVTTADAAISGTDHDDPNIPSYLGVGALGIGVDVGGIFWLKYNKNHPRTHTRSNVTQTQTITYHMRVSMDATIVPQHGQATTTHGEADLAIEDTI